MANEDNPASIFFNTDGVELPAPAGSPSPAVLSVQGVAGGTPIPVVASGGSSNVNVTEYGGTPTTLGQKTMASSIPITLASDQTPLPVTVSAGTDRTATGPITSAQNVAINTQASGACGVQVTGAWTGTIVFESTIDGVTWNPALAVNAVTGQEVTQTIANGDWAIACAGFQQVRARGATVATGTATVFLDASTCPQVVTLGGPIPAGSATIGQVGVVDGANQLGVNASGQAAIQNPSNLDVALSTRASAANQTNGSQQTQIVEGGNTAVVSASGALKVDGSAVTQPVSAASLPLPTGAATEATLSTRLADATFTSRVNTLGQKTSAASTPVVIASDQSPIPVTGTVTETNASIGVNGAAAPGSSTQVGGPDAGGLLHAATVLATAPAGTEEALVTRNIPSGTQAVSAIALPLPTGAATAANQTNGLQETQIVQGGNTTIVSATGALKVDASATTQPVSGTVTANQGTPNTLANAWPVEVTDGTNVLGTSTHPVRVDPTGTTTQPVSAVALPLPAGAATATNQTSGAQQTQLVQGGNVASVSAAGAVKVDGSAVTQPISAAALPLPTGASTAANQTTIGSQTTKINDGTNTAAVKAATVAPNVDDPALVVAVSPNTPTLPVSVASLPLPTGAATSANQTNGTQTTQLVQGANTASISAAGALKVDGSAVTQPVSAASLPLPTGAATAANQAALGAQTTKINDGTNTAAVKPASAGAVAADPALVVTLSPNSPLPGGTNALGSVSVSSWLGSTAPTVGQKVSASSLPVVIASDQTPVEVTGNTNPTYAASTNGTISTGTTAGTVASIAYLFHPAANAKRVALSKIVLSWQGNGGNNSLSFRLARITAENATPGGTVETINAFDQSDAASTLTFNAGATGAPTRAAGDYMSVAAIGGNPAQSFATLFDANVYGKPLILRAGQAEGYEVRSVIGGSNLASAVNASVYFIWTEV